MDNDTEFLKEWDLLSSAGENVEKSDQHEDSNIGSNNQATENEVPVENSGVQDITDQEAGVNESSSSDIDVIDENIEECVTSCVLPSSSLSITPTTEKSGSSSTEISCSVCTASISDNISTETKEPHVPPPMEEMNDSERFAEGPWLIGGRPMYDWICLFLEFLLNMSGLEWGVILALTMLVYVNISIHQTNTYGLEKEEVLFEMQKLVDELKNDNKMLKNQMLSEIQNDKVISSFEHQIRELKKDNSKLNYMLKDVVNVLHKQEDSQEKLFERKEAEYHARFKKEINKLKEHINILKFDNEELQKQLVRMRYASYSQGEKHSDAKDKKYEKKEKQPAENKETASDIPLDITHWKKWNILISMLAKELGISDGKEQTTEETPNPADPVEKTSSESEVKYDWSWKVLNKKFGVPNISEYISKYIKQNVQSVSNLYDTVNKYFNSAQENAQEVLQSFQEPDKGPETLKFLKSLKKYWAGVKSHYFTNSVKKASQPTDEDIKTAESPEGDANSDFRSSKENMKPKHEEFDKKSDAQFDSKDKAYKDQSDSDDTKWLFKRAKYRAQYRQDDESSINWFLRRGKELFEGRAFAEENNEDLFAEE